jgi:hypothetical protein
MAVRDSCGKRQMISDLRQKYGVRTEAPLQFNLVPDYMWVHPVHRNIDSSVGCVENIGDLARRGMKIEKLSVT